MSQVAWITGGGSGIGRALAEQLYHEGYRVVISGRRKNVLDEAAAAIKSSPGSGDIWAIAGDAGAPGYAETLYPKVFAEWGAISVLINNAGENPNHSFAEATPEEFEQNFRTNCMSAIRCTKAVLPAMLKGKSGTIVNISSVLGKWAAASSPAYSVSKYALAGFNDSIRQELAGTGVHVMGVYPGFIRTAMTVPFVKPGSARDRLGQSPDSMARAILRGIRSRKLEILFPWYVPLSLTLHHVFPRLMETLRKKSGH